MGVGGKLWPECCSSGTSLWASTEGLCRWASPKGLDLGLFFLGGEGNSKRLPALNPSFLCRLLVHRLTEDSTTGVAPFLDFLLPDLIAGAAKDTFSGLGTRLRSTCSTET